MRTIIGQDIDKLGILLAQISDLTKQANDIKKSLKESTLRELEGALFRAVVVEQDRTTYDVDVLKTAATPEILELAKRESFCVAVKVTARGV
jgi:hypothetical protein